MMQYALKNACMIVMILLAGIALSPTWAGGDHHEAKIKIIGDDFELDETDISDLAVGESMTFYTDSGREVLVIREEDGLDISVDGESLDIPRMSGGHHGVKVITREIVCDDDGECDHDFIHMGGESDIEFLHLEGEDLALDFEAIHDLHCDDEEICDHDVRIWHDGGDRDFELEDGSVFDFSDDHGNKVFIIKKVHHADEGEEI